MNGFLTVAIAHDATCEPGDEWLFHGMAGDKVRAGGLIGRVTPVLRPEKYRPDIRNHSVAMLHLELRTETCHLDGWRLDGERDKRLLDPTPYLKSKDLIIT